MTNHPIVDVLNTRFNGRISSGAHESESGAACILEVCAAARGIPHTDSPTATGMPDIRAINDAYADDVARSLAMVRLGVALWDWASWTPARQTAFAGAVALATVREVLPLALRSVGVDATACEQAQDLDAAHDAAHDAAYAANAAAHAAARAAARAAAHAARAARDAAYAHDAADAKTKVLDTVVDLWVRCVQETEDYHG